MAIALHVYIREKNANPTDPISTELVFYGRTEQQADNRRLAHLAGCEDYAKAEADGRTEEMTEEIPDVVLPTWEDVTADEGNETIDVEGTEIEQD